MRREVVGGGIKFPKGFDLVFDFFGDFGHIHPSENFVENAGFVVVDDAVFECDFSGLQLVGVKYVVGVNGVEVSVGDEFLGA
ncbi:MAG: hypothetical protein HC904_01320 [Blastochloris sp.]|nr:hypothetical protein [Blastochloris sp.]